MSQSKLKIIDVLHQQFDLLKKKMNGSASTSAFKLRKSALENVLSNGLPNRKSEEYKYTPLSRQLDKNMADFISNPSVSIDPEKIPDLGGLSIVFVNGEFNRTISNIDEIDGLRIEIASPELGLPQAEESLNDPFYQLNSALASDGVSITVKKNMVIENNINIIHIIDTSMGKVMATPKHTISLGENTQVNVSELFIGNGGNTSFTNSAMQITLAANSILNHNKVGFDSENDLRVDNTTCLLEGNSVLHTVNINFGGKAIRNNLNIVLDGEYCESNLDGLYMPEANGLVDNHTSIDHKLPNSNSNELYKGIMGDDATGVFNGKVFVREGAQKTNAFQSNKNILLSDTGSINTKPQLEIWADDVKCTHGCTTGQIDKEQLFYLRARGIDEQSARKLLLYAFAEEIVLKISDEKLRSFVEAKLDAELGE